MSFSHSVPQGPQTARWINIIWLLNSIPSMLLKEQKSPKAARCSPLMWAKCLWSTGNMHPLTQGLPLPKGWLRSYSLKPAKQLERKSSCIPSITSRHNWCPCSPEISKYLTIPFFFPAVVHLRRLLKVCNIITDLMWQLILMLAQSSCSHTNYYPPEPGKYLEICKPLLGPGHTLPCSWKIRSSYSHPSFYPFSAYNFSWSRYGNLLW